MAATIASYTQRTTSSTSSLTLDKPSGVAAGDLLMIFIAIDRSTATTQFDDSTYKPTGFTLVGAYGDTGLDFWAAVYYRIADGTEGATVACAAQSSGQMTGMYARITGHLADNGPAYHALDGWGTRSDWTVASYGNSSQLDRLWLIYHIQDQSQLFTVSTNGWSEVVEGGGSSVGYVVAEATTTPGPVGSCFIESSLNDTALTFRMSIRPPAVISALSGDDALASQGRLLRTGG